MADGSIVIDTKILDDGIRKGFSGLQSLAKGASIAIGAAVLGAAAAFGAFAVSATLAAEADQSANRRIEQIATSMGLYGDQTAEVTKRLTELATKTAIATGIDDNAIKATQAKLLTFKELAVSADEVGGAFDRATQAAIDMQAAGFGEAEQNAVQLGKALNDPIKGITALSRAGITFTEQEKEKIKVLVESGKTLEAQDMILSAIEKQVGGVAEATADTSARLKLVMGELEEAAGGPLLALFDALGPKLIDSLTALTPAIEQTFGGLAKILSGDASGAGDLGAGLSALGAGLVKGIESALPPLVAALSQVIVTLAQVLPSLLPPLATALLDGITTLAQALPQLVPAFVEALSQLLIIVAQSLPVLVPLLLDGFFLLLTSVMAQLPVLLPVVIQAFVDLLMGVAQSIGENFPLLMEGMTQLITSLVNMMPTLAPLLISAFSQLMVMSAQYLPQMLPVFASAMLAIIQALAATLPRMIPAIARAITAAGPPLAAAVRAMIPQMVNAAMSTLGQWANAGRNLVSGLWNGIADKAGWLIGQIKSWAGKITGALKKFFKIESPSKLLEDEIGVNLALGIGKGFTSSYRTVAAQMVGAVKGEMGRFLSIAPVPSYAMAGASVGGDTITQVFHVPTAGFSTVYRATKEARRLT